ncbi:MAG: MBL fold metallo-hydrolase, partial [Kiritimatiellae bacterium]|nr:MBL fold metallo-hydrolase [Kiritimatiellia bacterium]
MLTITFQGAARTTTGSMHYLEANGLKLLLDCGLYQGHRKEAFEVNRNIPFDIPALDYVILSHAHIDHSGNLPTLARRGFRGKVIATDASADLCEIMLKDSCYIQQQDLEFVNEKRRRQGKNLFEPLYVEKDVDAIMRHFQTEPLYREVDLGRGVSLVFHEAGHILGSAITELVVRGEGRKPYHLVFTGDLGNSGQPIIRDPAPVAGADAILIESTYADRDHPSEDDIMGRLKSYIDGIHQQKSRLVVPCFSVGRTQELLYFLNKLVERRRIPPTRIIVDSPLATRATDIYDRHKECYDEDAATILRSGRSFLDFPGLEFTRGMEESKALNEAPGPMVIISASGMCEGGRIVHHLRNNLGDPRNIVLFVGYQAEATLGRKIVNRQSPVKIFGEDVAIEARVETINALSAHADRGGLMRWFDASKGKALKRAYAVHGDAAQTDAMVRMLLA